MFTALVNKINSVIDNPKAEKVSTKGKTTNQIIEEIHESFFTEVDRLLSEANISKSLETSMMDLIKKRDRLVLLGFTGTREVIEANTELERLREIEKENQSKRELIEAIDYFSFNYPHYKFITEDSVKRICGKYNLVYTTVDRYIGTVPDANIKQMESFKIKPIDKVFEYSHVNFMGDYKVISLVNQKKAIEMNESIERTSHIYRSTAMVKECQLEIAAPLSDFNTEGMELKNFKLSKIEIPDPVVLQPVFFKGKKHYLVVTAWGLEASDDLVLNPKMN